MKRGRDREIYTMRQGGEGERIMYVGMHVCVVCVCVCV